MTETELANYIFQECDDFETSFNNEIALWNKKPTKLIILAEAPVSYSKYFYNNNYNGSFLGLLKTHYKLKGHQQFDIFLRQKGILVLDIYKYPIPSIFYRNDKNMILYDDKYIYDKIKNLVDENIINTQTKFIFRYKLLIDNGLYKMNALSNLNYLKINNLHIPLGVNRRSSILNTLAEHFLPQ